MKRDFQVTMQVVKFIAKSPQGIKSAMFSKTNGKRRCVSRENKYLLNEFLEELLLNCSANDYNYKETKRRGVAVPYCLFLTQQ